MAAPLPANSIVDTHTHTFYSDGVGTFEQNARAAAEAGCRVIVSTDHLTLPQVMNPAGDLQVVEADLPRHRADFEAARDAHPEIEYIYGFECDWYPGCEDNIRRWSEGAVVRLGSVHWIGSQEDGAWIDDPEDQRIWEQLGPDEVWRRYQRAWIQACQCDLFDIMAHPDLAQRFSEAGYAPTINLEPLWDEMATCARDCGKRVELSTAAWRKGLRDYYPAEGLLARFFRAGVPISVGSDGHYPADICDGIAKAYAHAYRMGYRAVEVPRADGSWEQMPIG